MVLGVYLQPMNIEILTYTWLILIVLKLFELLKKFAGLL